MASPGGAVWFSGPSLLCKVVPQAELSASLLEVTQFTFSLCLGLKIWAGTWSRSYFSARLCSEIVRKIQKI